MFIHLSKNKYFDIKKVCPNFTQNRYDCLFGDNFEILKVSHEEQIFYIPFHISFITCKLGLVLVDIPQEVISKIANFIFQNYKYVFVIKIIECGSFYGTKTYNDIGYWINLPKTADEYIANFSKKTRYNLRRNIKKLKNEIGDYKITKYTQTTVPDSVIKEYFKLKYKTIKKSYMLSVKGYLKKYFVTSIYTLSVNDKIGAIVLISETDENVYLENITYNPVLSKYSVGITCLIEVIKDMIKQGKVNFFFGSSNRDDYKSLLCNKSKPVYSIKIYRHKFKNSLFL